MDEASKQLLSMGLPGIVIIGLFGMLVYVFRLYVAVQEKRISEGVDNRTAIERNTAAFSALTEVVKATKGT